MSKAIDRKAVWDFYKANVNHMDMKQMAKAFGIGRLSFSRIISSELSKYKEKHNRIKALSGR